MDEDDVHVMITAALAAQEADFQVMITAALAAQAQQQPQQQPQLPVVFSLTPGVANPTIPWNYSTSEGMKLYFNAVSALTSEYKGDDRSLKVFLSGITSKALQFGWETLILMIPDEAGTVRNLLKNYTIITNADIKAHAATYILLPTRAAQASAQLARCILSSLDPVFLVKLLTRQGEYTMNGVELGPAMLKTVCSLVTIETKSAVPLIKGMLGDLRPLIKDYKSNITDFNVHVKDLMNQLEAANGEYDELLHKLFEAYQTASDNKFVLYIANKQSQWEDHLLELTADGFMSTAESKYRTMIVRKTWNEVTKEESDIITLKAEMLGLVALNAELMSSNKKKPGKKEVGRVNDAKWEWKLIAPTGDQAKEKSFEGKNYIYCPFHPETKWVLKKNHVDGCKNDPKHEKPPATPVKAATPGKAAEPTKKQLKYAQVLMSVMGTAELDDDDVPLADEQV